jgi:hypothetical protein
MIKAQKIVRSAKRSSSYGKSKASIAITPLFTMRYKHFSGSRDMAGHATTLIYDCHCVPLDTFYV